jgi:hypothetical protein
MSTQVQRRRGTTAQHATFTGAVGEITVDTDKDVVVVHDGTTAGGHPSAKTSGANTFTGDQTFTGDVILTGAGKGVVFEGTTADANETTLTAGEPTADRTINTPDASGELVVAPSLQAQTYTAYTTGGSSTAYTLTPTPALAALAENQEFDVEFHTAAGATPTLAISGLTAKSLKYRGSGGTLTAVTSTQIPAGWRSKVTYDGTDYVVREIPPTAAGGAGKTVQRGYAEYTTAAALSPTIPIDDTIPQNTEGTEIMTVSLGALSSATNRVRVTFFGHCETVTDSEIVVALFWDSVANAIHATPHYGASAQQCNTLAFCFEHVPGDTAAHTYKIRAGSSSTNLWFNAATSSRLMGGVSRAALIVEEIQP